MYKEGLLLNKLKGLICYKTKPTNQPTNQLTIFCLMLFICINCILQRRWAFPLSAIVCISYWPGLPGILLMCLSVHFIDLTQDSPSRYYWYFNICWNWYSNYKASFFIILNDYIKSIALIFQSVEIAKSWAISLVCRLKYP